MNTIIMNKIQDLMTKDTVTSFPDMIMTEVSDIFDKNTFHHLPVIDNNGVCVGIISKSDYFQLQNHFTKMNDQIAAMNNRKLFRSLLASEVMTPNPVSIDINDSLNKAVDLFLENKYHSLVVIENGKYAGIITPYDILKQLNK